MEKLNCSSCELPFYRQAIPRKPLARGAVKYVNELGKRTEGAICRECYLLKHKAKYALSALNFKGRKKVAPAEKDGPDVSDDGQSVYVAPKLRPCSYCTTMTPNRFYCASCWTYRENLSNQDNVFFTKEEMLKIHGTSPKGKFK